MRVLTTTALIVMTIPAAAQEPNCKKPEFPACAWDAEVWINEDRLQACMTETEAVYEEMRDYRHCLRDFRDEAIFLVDNKLAHIVAEMAAMAVFSQCRIQAGPAATLEDIQRCPIPDFVQD